MQGNIVRVLEQSEFSDMKIIVESSVEEVRQFILSLPSLQEFLPVSDQSLRAGSIAILQPEAID